MTSCTGVILAGGRATRYGGLPKGLERVGGQRIIDRVAGVLREVASDLLLIANAEDAASWLPTIKCRGDVIADAGSLGGIHAALSHAGSAVLVVAWDMPFVPAPLLKQLVLLGGAHDAVIPESESKRGAEPLCAFYSQACLEPIVRRLASGDRRVVSFLEDVRAMRVPHEDVQRFGDPAVMFMNVNSPDELALANAYDATISHRRRAQA